MPTGNQIKIGCQILLWIARVIGFLASAVFLFIFVGEGITETLDEGINAELLPFLPFLFIAVAGYVIALYKGKRGGILQVAGGIGMAVYHIISGGTDDIGMAALFGLPYILGGLIFWVCEPRK